MSRTNARTSTDKKKEKTKSGLESIVVMES
jgi:hypothetical protein